MKLPRGLLKSLIRQGYSATEAMKEAWRRVRTQRGRHAMRRTVAYANPGAAWHKGQKQLAEALEKQETRPRRRTYYRGMADAHTLSAHESRKMGLNPTVAYDVFLRGKKIDTVFQSGKSSAEEVKRSLVEHDGYDPDIHVVRQRKKKVRKNPGASQAGATAARELLLWIENHATVQRQQGIPIANNLLRKMRRGTYDREKAVKLWLYLVDEAAKSHGIGASDRWFVKAPIPAYFNRATRLHVARQLRDKFEQEVKWFRVTKNPRRRSRRNPLTREETRAVLESARTYSRLSRRGGRSPRRGTDSARDYFTGRRDAMVDVARGMPRTFKRTREKRPRRNPIAVYNPPPGRMIYGRVLAVEAQKTNGSHRGKRFRHSFAGDSRVAAYALSDGSVLLKSMAGKRLWQDR